MRLGDAEDAQGDQKMFEHGHVAYQIDEDGEQNRMQTGDLGVRSNGQISLNFKYNK